MDKKKNVRIKLISKTTDLIVPNLCEEIIEEYDLSGFDDEEVTEYSTDAVITETERTVELKYTESEEMGMGGTETTLVFSKTAPGELTMLRYGKNKAVFHFSADKKRKKCVYHADGNFIELGILTRQIENSLTLTGGEIYIDYILEFRGTNTQRNRLHLTAKEVKGGNIRP